MTDYKGAHAAEPAAPEFAAPKPDPRMPSAEQYRDAQSVLDTHVTSTATHRCIACGAVGPCYLRDKAASTMFRYLWLPTRIPGATQPQRIKGRRVEIGPRYA